MAKEIICLMINKGILCINKQLVSNLIISKWTVRK